MLECIKCGNDNPNDSLFCNKCGEKIVDVHKEPLNVSNVKKTNSENKSNINKNKKKTFIFQNLK